MHRGGGGGGGVKEVRVRSEMGLREDGVDVAGLARRVAQAMERSRGAGPASAVARVEVRGGGVLALTSVRGYARGGGGGGSEGGAGAVVCPECGRLFGSARTKSPLEWHLKAVHGVQSHAEACRVANEAKARAMVVREGALPLPRAEAGRMTPAPSLGCAGLDACRAGDLKGAVAAAAAGVWNPATGVDRNGAGGLLWAAGGGHLDVCRWLCSASGGGVDPKAAVQRARRGFDGRTALHYAARNGRVEVVRWLVREAGCNVDERTVEGTTAFCWACWQGQEETCRLLAGELGADPHVANAFGCTAALWAAQGKASVALCAYLASDLGVSFRRVNGNAQGPLHKAAQRGGRALCEWLVRPRGEGGAGILDPPDGPLAEGEAPPRAHLAPNADEGSTPSQLAAYAGFPDLAAYLVEVEAFAGARDKL